MSALIMLAVFLILFYCICVWLKQSTQLAFIRAYEFHPAIAIKLRKKHPQLTDAQITLVIEGLRDYFHICNQAKGKMISMPSQVVDDAWHEFILFSRDYETFCHKALGRFLYHTPAEAMQTPTSAQEGIKRAWRLACNKENIEPQKPRRFPRLFAIDTELAIAGGFLYSLDYKALNSDINIFCASDIGCGGEDGGCGGGCGG